ncbi:hypothetical protein [Haloechinothrix salitolerans]|uniref:hypothetical protein n=1 Tax=Haloechinothrix salitolerans TaxID=926830 RepID=UPI0031E7A6E8
MTTPTGVTPSARVVSVWPCPSVTTRCGVQGTSAVPIACSTVTDEEAASVVSAPLPHPARTTARLATEATTPP